MFLVLFALPLTKHYGSEVPGEVNAVGPVVQHVPLDTFIILSSCPFRGQHHRLM